MFVRAQSGTREREPGTRASANVNPVFAATACDLIFTY
jgi:hypothetical protein